MIFNHYLSTLHHIKGFKLLTLVLWGVTFLPVFANATERKGDSSISISPRSCLVKDDKSYCEKDLVISWKFKERIDFCLLVDNGLILFCENDQLKGSKTLSNRLKKTTRFEVVEQGTQRKLSEITVYVIKENAAKLRKRYRHPWSIF